MSPHTNACSHIEAHATLFATRLLGSLLYEVTPVDVFTYASVVVALLASFIAARQALAVEPMAALRRD